MSSLEYVSSGNLKVQDQESSLSGQYFEVMLEAKKQCCNISVQV